MSASPSPSDGPAADLRTRLLDAAGLALDRLPMLNVIFDRLATACGDGLKHLAASSILYTLSGVASGRFGEFLDAYDSNVVRYQTALHSDMSPSARGVAYTQVLFKRSLSKPCLHT